MPTTHCPVAPLADEASRLIGLLTHFQHAPELGERVFDKLLAVQKAASQMTPRSAKGALFLALVTFAEVDCMAGMLEGEDRDHIVVSQAALRGLARGLAQASDERLMRYYLNEGAAISCAA